MIRTSIDRDWCLKMAALEEGCGSVAAVGGAFDRTATEERAAIVAWLQAARGRAESPEIGAAYGLAASAIERGEHLEGPGR